MPNKFCKEMKKARKRQGLGYRKLEIKTGISKTYLSQIEKGSFLPSISIGMNIVNALGLDKDTFIRYLFDQELNRIIDRIKGEAKLYGIEVPPEVFEMGQDYIQKVWQEAYSEGLEHGRVQMNMEIRNQIESILDSE